MHVKSDPHSASLRSAPLPRSTGERKRRPQGLASFLYPIFMGERCRAKRGGVGVVPHAIALSLIRARKLISPLVGEMSALR